jgi:signal peptidase I
MVDAKNLQGTWWQAISSLTISVLVILTIRWAFFEPFVIPSGSMIPTLLIHDHILVNKFAYGLRVPFTNHWLFHTSDPARGDIVVFKSLTTDGIFLVKRVIGLPGDEILYNEKSELVINGKVIPTHELSDAERDLIIRNWPQADQENYKADFRFLTEEIPNHQHVALRRMEQVPHSDGPYRVPPGYLFMMGDNRDNSTDSRVWGALPLDHVLGQALWIWLSCEDTLPAAGQMCDPQSIRWPRIFQKLQ